MQRLGFPAPGLMAWVATRVECLGGLAPLIEALVPLAAALLTIEVLVAMSLPWDAQPVPGSGTARAGGAGVGPPEVASGVAGGCGAAKHVGGEAHG